MLIEILGIIGVGKSTLMEKFSNSYIKINEPVKENPYLEDFYLELQSGDYKCLRTIPLMEIYLQNKRYYELTKVGSENKNIVTDWGYPEVFAKILYDMKLISNRDYDTFKLVVQNTRVESDLIFYLSMSPEQALKNIKARNRECERGITKEYLTNLDNNYLRILAEKDNVWVIDWSDYDINKIVNILKRYNLSL